MALNVTYASFDKRRRSITVDALFQWDYGQILKIQGLNLPPVYEVHYSLNQKEGKAIRLTGTEEGV